MTSQLTVYQDVEGFDALSGLEVGSEVKCVVSGTVKSNDDNGLVLDVSGVEEPESDEYEDSDESGDEMPHMGEKGNTPIAIIAIGGGPKK